MPTTYLNRIILTPEEFVAQQAEGWSHPDATYEGYLQMIRSQMRLALRDRAELAARGIEVSASAFDPSPEMEAALAETWAETAACRKAAEAAQPLSAAA